MKRVLDIGLPILVAVLVIGAWQWTVMHWQVPTYVLPAPSAIVTAFLNNFASLMDALMATFLITIAGFIGAVATALALAILFSQSRLIERSLYPYAVILQVTPVVAIAPLFVVWFGFGIVPKIISAFLLGFFPVVVSAVQGFKSVDPDMVDLARAMQGSRFHVFRAVNLPHAMPAIFSGLKVSVTLAVVGAVVGEFVGSNSGIGYVLQRSIGTFDLPTMFAALVILALLGVILFWIVDRIERLVIPWHVSRREDIIFAS